MVSVKNPNFVPNKTIVDLKPIDRGATSDKAAPKTPITKPKPELDARQKAEMAKWGNGKAQSPAPPATPQNPVRTIANPNPTQALATVDILPSSPPPIPQVLNQGASHPKPTTPPVVKRETPPKGKDPKLQQAIAEYKRLETELKTTRGTTAYEKVRTRHDSAYARVLELTPGKSGTSVPARDLDRLRLDGQGRLQVRPQRTTIGNIPTVATPAIPRMVNGNSASMEIVAPAPTATNRDRVPTGSNSRIHPDTIEHQQVPRHTHHQPAPYQATERATILINPEIRGERRRFDTLGTIPVAGRGGEDLTLVMERPKQPAPAVVAPNTQQVKTPHAIDHGARTQIRPAVNPGTVQARRQRVQIDPIAMGTVRQAGKAAQPTRLMLAVQTQIISPVPSLQAPARASAQTVLTPTVSAKPTVVTPAVVTPPKVQAPTVKGTSPSAPKGKGWFGKVFTVGVVVVGAGIAAYKAADGQGGRAALNNLKQLASVDTLVGLVPGGSVVMGAYRRREATGNIGVWETAKDAAVEVASTVSAPVGIALTVGGLAEQAMS